MQPVQAKSTEVNMLKRESEQQSSKARYAWCQALPVLSAFSLILHRLNPCLNQCMG